MAEFTRVFGREPRGIWCSEMAVGETVIPLLAEAGIEWTLGDEGVLARSLGRDIARDDAGHVRDPRLLYSAYRLERESHELAIVFRDRTLSDLIGFTYQDLGRRGTLPPTWSGASTRSAATWPAATKPIS